MEAQFRNSIVAFSGAQPFLRPDPMVVRYLILAMTNVLGFAFFAVSEDRYNSVDVTVIRYCAPVSSAFQCIRDGDNGLLAPICTRELFYFRNAT
jgi:hypothetical protein